MASTASRMLMDLLRQPAGQTLPQAFYGDADYHRLDLEEVFYKEWLFAGHGCEIAKAGDFLTLQVGDYPLLVVRGQDGKARAFHNVCRHRGSRVCTAARGSRAKLVCGYHRWTYDLDGRLLFARDMGPDFDAAKHALRPVACEEVGGYIFLSLAEAPSDFGAFRAAAEPYMLPHRLAEAKVAHETTIVEKGNWKLVLENNRECYHCGANHPSLCRVFPDTPTLTDGATVEQSAPGQHWRRCEEAGLPSRFRLSADGQYRTARMPFIGAAQSMTPDGQPAVRRPLADFPIGNLGSMVLFYYPNTWNHLLADHALSFRVLPLGPRETEVTTKWLVHRDAVEGVDYDLKALTQVWLETNEEDRRIVEENQRGIASPAYRPGPYSPVHEAGVMQFLAWYRGVMTSRLRGEGQAASDAA